MAPPIEPKPSLMGSAAAFSDSSDRSDALPCPIVPLAMQTLVGTANSGEGKCPLTGICWQCVFLNRLEFTQRQPAAHTAALV